MAKKIGDGSKTAAVEETGLVIPGGMELLTDLPADFRPSAEGTEDITMDEVRMPRISIAQGLSPQMDPDNGKYIDGLRLFEMFNDLSGELYGRGPLFFVPIKRNVVRIEFRPRSEGGGVIDMDVPVNDPRLEWSRGADGKNTPPKATTFFEFISLLLKPDRTIEPVAISIKTTNKDDREAAKRLNSFIKAAHKGVPVPIYGKVYQLTSSPSKNDKGTFGVHVINQAGFAPTALVEKAKGVLDSLQGKVIVVNREPGDDTSFDPNEM